MAILKCKMCGGTLNITEGMTVCECEYCGTQQTITTSQDENMQALFNRANILRMKSEFDKAEQLYEKLVQNNPEDAEAHWGLILCKFGIEYVEDPATFKRISTCHRTSFDSIIADEDYKEAIRCADTVQRGVYEREAKEIDRLQKEILALSAKEEPYDVFICYKESDGGSRTPDSVIANDIYHQLTNEGFKVFYAAITLEDKLGSAYEPCIFAALNSAKVMLAIGTKPEYFTAVWVRNEWSRFLKMMKKDRSKLLIPCYKDMDAYELPEEFAHLQAQDMSKIGFINDLVRGIKKVIVKEDKKPAAPAAPVSSGNANVNSLLRRVFIFLEDGDWSSADEYCEKVLDLAPENGEAYLGKLMAELKVSKRDNLKNYAQPFDSSSNYKKVMRYADDVLREEMQGCIFYIKERNNNYSYNHAVNLMKTAKSEKEYKKAAEIFRTIPGWKDSDTLVKECLKNAENTYKDAIYVRASNAMKLAKTEDDYKKVAEILKTISGWKDSDECIEICQRKIKEIAAEEETHRLEKERKVTAIVSALKAGRVAKKEPTLNEIITKAKTKVEYLERILKVFDSTQAQINALQSELDQANLQEKQLTDQRLRLSIFDFKEKKRIDKVIAVVLAKKGDLVAQISKQQDTIGRYATVTDVECDLIEARKSLIDLESTPTNLEYKFSFEKALSIYQNSPDIAADVNNVFPAARFILAIHGETNTIKFGRYVHKKNGLPEPIEWQVLAREDGQMLVVSKYVLDSKKYNSSARDTTWEKCSLRKWLNNDFLSKAFNSEEQKLIKNSTVIADRNPKNNKLLGNNTTDKLFLLSITEAKKYYSSDEMRKCAPTEYAISKGADTINGHIIDGKKSCWWWLRSPGSLSDRAALVGSNGSINLFGINVFNFDTEEIFRVRKIFNGSGAVRPAMWINLEK